MRQTDLLLGEFESVASVYRWDDGELVRLTGHAAGPMLAFVAAAEDGGRALQETMTLVACAGVPECRRAIRAGSGATAIVLEGAEDARPLALVHDLPADTLRAGLTSLLRTLNTVHSRGFVHGAIDRSTVLADPSGRFWLIGWGVARPVSDAPRPSGSLTEATEDLRDLACAFREALLRRPWPDPQAATIHDRRPRTHAGQDLIDAGVKVDRDFARVLSRLVGCDPRETYSGATDVLVDLSVQDATAFDPWESLPAMGIRREVARVLRLLNDTQHATSETVHHAASVDYVGPGGSGKSRLLAEIARAARSRDVIVLTAEGGARGTWGGVGSLARQLVQLLGRDARMCRQHEDALRHLLDDRDSSSTPHPQPAPGLGLEGRNSLTASCTAALTDMARIAFRRTPGLLVLDDEEHLPAAARDVWRASGQFVQAVNGAGGVLRVLLVSASTCSYPAEIGAHRVTVEMRTWRQRDLEKFLAYVFASPGGTRDVSVAIHRITGGRPGDVIAYLRDLEARGALRREGLRWRLDVPLAALPAVTGGVSERVRRALDACGRDATTLVEVLAVATDVTLGRTAVGEIGDVRGPRLAAAAESAKSAGLVVADGSGWRIRTDAIAHKVYAAIPDDRRKVLHREVLQHLLDTATDALDPIARHARASSDPRATAWTEQAIAKAREDGEWGRALEHAEQVADECGRNDTPSTLERAELLAALGRPGLVVQLLDNLRSRVQTTQSQTLAVCLAIARAHYDAREWHELIARGVPEAVSEPRILAEIRYLRASAMCHISQKAMARREARLADAEAVGETHLTVALARLEYEYQEALYSNDWLAAQSALLSKIRAARSNNDWRQVVIDLTKLGNATRFLLRNHVRAHTILTRAVGVCRQDGVCEIEGTVRSALHAAIAYVCVARGASRRGCRHFSRSAFHAAQSGVASLLIAARLRYISCAVESGQATYDDKRYVDGIVHASPRIDPHAVLSASIDLGMCLLFYGHQSHLEQFARDLRRVVPDDHRSAVLEGLSVVGGMWLHGPSSVLRNYTGDSLTPRELTKWLVRRRLGDLWLCAIVFAAMEPTLNDDPWIRDLVSRGGAARIVTRRRTPGWGSIAAALGLALWIPIEYDSTLWASLLRVVRSQRGPLPVGLEWQRVLMESREAMRSGQLRNAQSLRRSALDQLDLIDDGIDPGLRHAVLQWRAMVAETSSASLESFESRETAVQSGRRERRVDVSSATGACAQHWSSELRMVRQARHIIVVAAHARELQLFSDVLLAEVAESTCRIEPDLRGTVDQLGGPFLGIVVLPERWTSIEATRVAVQVRRLGETGARTAVLTAFDVVELRSLGAGHAALVEASDGCLVTLTPLLRDETARRTWLDWACAMCHADAAVSPDAAQEIERYAWPGGLGELETVVQAAASVGDNPITLDTLHRTGWRERVAWSTVGGHRMDNALVELLRANGPSTIGVLSDRLGCPRRTMLRHVQRLVLEGLITRHGRGRATRYGAPFVRPRHLGAAPREGEIKLN